MRAPEGMSDDVLNTCMRSFDKAVVRENYLGSLRPRFAAEEDGYINDPDIYDYDCPNKECPCDHYRSDPTLEEDCPCGNEDCPCKCYHMVASIDYDCHCDRIHLYPGSGLADNEDNQSETLRALELEKFRKRSPSVASSTQSYSYRSFLSDDEALEADLTTFDSLLSRLLPEDSPLIPTRILRYLQPGCKDCYLEQAHPLTKYKQYEHDMRQLNKLLNERETEWSDFAHELMGSEDWEYGFNGWVSVQKLQHKWGCMLSAIDFWEWQQLELEKGDMGFEELGQWMGARLLEFQDQMRELERQMELEELQALTGGL
ncbi:MAG: hypothetical protein LQ337_005650 [Flavoplaca oasis]|nr:MAG: hypothetical protein LQ337_005650 [Flavoplaca oasis]